MIPYIPKIETSQASEIKAYQETRLKEMLRHIGLKSKYYKNLFRQNNIDINKVKFLEDLTRIPTTSKDVLQRQNGDFICVDREKIIDYSTTSGTLGEPLSLVMTGNDLDRLAYNEYISFGCAEGTAKDIFQLMVTIDRRFMAGLAYFLGLRKLGAGVIRVGPGNPELQFDTIAKFNPTSIVAVPSFLINLIEYASHNGIDCNKTGIQKAVCIGESLRNPDFTLNSLGSRILNNWNLKLFSTYASTEMGTAFTECQYGMGGHHHPEMIIIEFLDDNDNPVAEGEPGELTITTLGVEAMPLLRFKTGDICNFQSNPCPCGRNTVRLGPIIGRKQQMIKYKGTAFYPPAIYDILNGMDGVENYIVEISASELGTDDILIKIGCNDPGKKTEAVIKDHFRAKLRVAPEILFLPVEEINKIKFSEKSRKPITLIDRRYTKPT